jgi:hypothetical protein
MSGRLTGADPAAPWPKKPSSPRRQAGDRSRTLGPAPSTASIPARGRMHLSTRNSPRTRMSLISGISAAGSTSTSFRRSPCEPPGASPTRAAGKRLRARPGTDLGLPILRRSGHQTAVTHKGVKQQRVTNRRADRRALRPSSHGHPGHGADSLGIAASRATVWPPRLRRGGSRGPRVGAARTGCLALTPGRARRPAGETPLLGLVPLACVR